mmetsp:Transcript_36886/g.77878  ORF Transcript_36886/g.77878 Transcript_36886/m.77878 type:complete len:984 (+) Transcript_36886:161-3112(+)
MFISHWVKFSGLDQVIAPIESDAALPPEEEDAKMEESPFWEIVAPRAKPAPAEQAQQQHAQDNRSCASATDAPSRFVRCQHCHQMTPVDDNAIQKMQQPHPSTPANDNGSYPKTPYNTPALLQPIQTSPLLTNNDDESIFHTSAIQSEQEYLHQQVLRAAHETALTSSGPTFAWENKHTLFSLCAAPPKPPKKGKDGKPILPKLGADGKAVPSKNIKKLDKLLNKKNAHELISARSANMTGSLGLPDGFTVLHAACHAGNGEVVEYLLKHFVVSEVECDGGAGPALDLSERDLQGRTALHIAADRGHIEVIQLLRAAYDELEERAKKMLMEEDSDDDSDSDDEVDAGLAESMAKLKTSDSSAQPQTVQTESKKAATPKTPKSKSPMRQRKPRASRSPKPPSRRSPMKSPMRKSPMKSPTFAGRTAPVDLSGRTPLGYAATSPVPKARKHRSEMEKLLYAPGDRSINGVGGAERTPPKARCGPRGMFNSPFPVGRGTNAGNGPKTATEAQVGGGGTDSYLSPTPRKHRGYGSSPGSMATANFATPFQSPQPTIPEDGEVAVVQGNNEQNALRLQWGASEMNGWRIEMEDKILVKYELYGEGETVPPNPATPDGNSKDDANPTMGLFGVFDGHGDGGFASDFIASHLESKLKSHPEWPLAYYGCNNNKHSDLVVSVLTQACHELDDDLRKDATKPRDGGTTAIVAMVSNAYLFVANVGDSRCILVTKRTIVKQNVADSAEATEETEGSTEGSSDSGKDSIIQVVPMSEDHKPDLPEERSRIESSGLSVQTDHVPPSETDPDGEFTTVHRVKKSDTELLGVSRAFGDYDYKSNKELSATRQAVVCTPEVVVRERSEGEDMYLVLACDGVWDVMSNDEVGAFVVERVAHLLGWMGGDTNEENKEAVEDPNGNDSQGEVLARVGDDLLAECLRKGSRDNMSVLIVALPASGLVTGKSDSAVSSLPLAEVGTKKKEQLVDDTVRALEYE